MSILGASRAVRASAMEAVIGDFQQAFVCSRDEIERMTFAGQRSEVYHAGAQVRSVERTERSGVLLSGWACEQRILLDGRRQIFSFLMAGDPVVIAGEGVGARSIQALTRLEFADLTSVIRSDERTLQGGAGAAFRAAMATQQNRLFDHVVRLGRQTACERVAHLFLELRDRLQVRGQVQGDTFRIPLTQEALADALGLSIVHVNRTLRQLRCEGLIELKSGGVTLLKPARLSAMAGHGGAIANPVATASPAWGRYG